MREHEALVERLERLERTNRRYASALAMLLCGAVAVSVIGANPREIVSEAERFILRDAAGKVRAEMCATPNGPALSFFDPSGAERLRLHANDDGNTVLSLKTGIRDESSERAVDIRTGNDGWSSLSFLDGGTRERLSLGLAYDGEPRLRMNTPGGKSRISIGSDMSGRAEVIVHDGSGTERGVLRSAPGGSTSLSLYDSEGSAIFSAPGAKRPNGLSGSSNCMAR